MKNAQSKTPRESERVVRDKAARIPDLIAGCQNCQAHLDDLRRDAGNRSTPPPSSIGPRLRGDMLNTQLLRVTSRGKLAYVHDGRTTFTAVSGMLFGAEDAVRESLKRRGAVGPTAAGGGN